MANAMKKPLACARTCRSTLNHRMRFTIKASFLFKLTSALPHPARTEPTHRPSQAFSIPNQYLSWSPLHRCSRSTRCRMTAKS